MQLTISQICHAARLQPGLLSAETAAFLLLSFTEDAALERCLPDAECLQLEPGGGVTASRLRPATPSEVDRGLRRLLGELLQGATGTNPRLRAVAAGAGADLEGFRAELTTALIPINRAAAHRALVRLHRRASEVIERAGDAALLPQVDTTPVVAAARERAVTTVENVAHAAFAVLPVNQVVFHQAPEPPESVTPFLGNLEIAEWSADVPNGEIEALDLTDPMARVGWLTDGGASVAEPRPSRTSDDDPALLPRAELDDCSAEEELALTHRIWGLPATAPKPELSVSPEAPPEPLCPAPLEAESVPVPVPVPVLAEAELQGPEATPEVAIDESTPTRCHTPVALRDNPAAAAAAAVGPSPYVASFNPAASDVARLLEEFAPEVFVPTRVVENRLRGYADGEAHDEPSLTPPPVDAAPDLPGTPEPAARTRSLAALASAAAVLAGALVVRDYRGTASFDGAAAPASRSEAAQVLLPLIVEPCRARVEIHAEADATVQLLVQEERLSGVGDVVRFDAVPCSEDVRLVIRRSSSSNHAGEWVQLPVPRAQLEQAAGAGHALILRPLVND